MSLASHFSRAEQQGRSDSAPIEEIVLQFIESSNDVFWITRLRPEQEIYVSPAVERVWGVTAASFEDNPRRWAEKIVPEDRPGVLREFEAWINGGPDSKFDTIFRIYGPDGEVRWVHDRGIWLSREPDGVRVVAGIATDITELKVVERTLHARERDLRRVLEDRERMNQDLHDNTLQSLYAVGLELNAAQLLLAGESGDARARLQAATRRLNQVIKGIRSFIQSGPRPVPGNHSFAGAVAELASEFGASAGAAIELDLTDEACSRLDPDAHLDLMSIIKESLSNALRHGYAKNVGVSLGVEDDIVVRVTDDGRGFDLQAAGGRGLGLSNMRARAERLGAEFSISSAPGQGTTVALRLPKQAGSDEADLSESR